MNTLDERPRTAAEAAANRAFWFSVLSGILVALALPLFHGLTSLIPAAMSAREDWERVQVETAGIRQQVELLENEHDRVVKNYNETSQKAEGLESQAGQAIQDAEKLAQEASLSAEEASKAESRQDERLEAVIQALDAQILSSIRKNP